MLEKLEERIKSEKYYMILSAVYIALGILMIVWKGLTVERLGLIAAIVLLAVGAVRILYYFKKKDTRNYESDLSVGVMAASFGAFLLMHRSYTTIVIPFAVGVLILIGAMVKIQYSLYMKQMNVHRWNIMLIFGLVLLALGILLLAGPFPKDWLPGVIAISLMLDGALNIASYFFILHRIKQLKKGNGEGLAPQNPPEKKKFGSGKNRQTQTPPASAAQPSAPAQPSSAEANAGARGQAAARAAGSQKGSASAGAAGRPSGPSTAPAGPGSYTAPETASAKKDDVSDAGGNH